MAMEEGFLAETFYFTSSRKVETPLIMPKIFTSNVV